MQEEKLEDVHETESTKSKGTPEVYGEIELPPIDVSKHIGAEVPIVKAELREGKFGWYYLVSTEDVDKEIGICASRILGLKQDAEGRWGWPAESKTALFLKKMNVKKPEELIGKKVKVQTKETANGEFLTF